MAMFNQRKGSDERSPSEPIEQTMTRPRRGRERFIVSVQLPTDGGEPVSRSEIADYIRLAVRGTWTWAKRMKWTVRLATGKGKR